MAQSNLHTDVQYPQNVSGEMPLSDDNPSAPPLDQMQVIHGYENVTFTPVELPPPSYTEAVGQSDAPIQRQMLPIATINEEEVKEAIEDFVDDNCCYGKGPLKDIKLKEIVMNSAVHYKLETFTEKRETAWVFEPYTGQLICGPNQGPSPGPWNVFVPPDAPFKKGKKIIEVPNSAVVKPCHDCVGNGRIRCRHCNGFGGSTCISCNGRGHNDHHHHHHHHDRCISCDGTGRSRCSWCNGHGQSRCHTCAGKGQLKCFLQLTVKWYNHVEEFVSDKSSIPENLIKKVSGNIAFDERYPRVYPLTNFPDASVIEASRSLIQKHSHNFPMERIIEQRHNVQIIPVAFVTYNYKSSDGFFYVYGLEHKTHFPNYPSKCCWGCTIL